MNGKPIVFFWREQLRSVDDWVAIRTAVDPNHDQIWIAEGVNVAYRRVFDGHHLYSIAWSSDVSHTLMDWASRVRHAGADKLWVATVMPGYSSIHIRPVLTSLSALARTGIFIGQPGKRR